MTREAIGARYFFARLADTGEGAFFRIAAGGEHPKKFTAGNDIETGASVGQQLQNRSIRIRFDRVTDQVIEWRQSGIETAVMIEDGSGAVNIERRPKFLHGPG